MRYTAFFIGIILLLTACLPTLRFEVDNVPTTTPNASQLTRVTSFANESTLDLDISPDGRFLLITTQKAGGFLGADTFGLSLIDPTKPEQTRPIGGSGFVEGTFMPDGNTIILTNLNTPQQQLVKTAIDGAGLTFISNNPFGASDQSPDISPDGRKIAFNTGFAGSTTIAVVNIDGTELTTYVQGKGPKWSPDGSQILFYRDTGSSSRDILILDLATGAITQLTTGSVNNYLPSWSPDGQRIVFTSNRSEERAHIFTMNKDGSNIVQLTQGNSNNAWPIWSSDGFIYFSSTAGSSKRGVSNVWRLLPEASN